MGVKSGCPDCNGAAALEKVNAEANYILYIILSLSLQLFYAGIYKVLF